MGTFAESADRWGGKVFRGKFLQQFAALLYKNVLVAWRSRRSTAIRIVAPFVFLLLALIVNLAVNANNQLQERVIANTAAVVDDIPGIPPCETDLYIAGRPCIDFVYSPNNDTFINDIMSNVMTSNVPSIPPSKVQGFPTRAAAEQYLLSHPDGALGAVYFHKSAGNGSISYIVQSNSTTKYFKGVFQDPTQFFSIPMMNAVARELSRGYVQTAAAKSAAAAADVNTVIQWQPRMAKFPHPNLQTTSLLGQVLSSFIFASLMFGFVTQMGTLVSEKDMKLRLALRNMGMLESSYWCSWMMYDAMMTFVIALLLVIFGMILQFNYFLKNDFGLLLLLFWLFGLAMTSFSYLLSVFVSKTQGAVYLGFSVFIVGWVFQTVQFLAKLPYDPSFYYSQTNKWGRVFFWVFNLFPWNPLTKGIMDFNQATLAPTDPGIRWSQQYSYCTYQPDPALQQPYDPQTEFKSYSCVYPLYQAYWIMVVQWAVYWLLAVYLNNVLPNEVGTRRPWWYPFSRAYWRPRPADSTTALQRVLQQETAAAAAGSSAAAAAAAAGVASGDVRTPGDEEMRDDDVLAEEAKMKALLLARTGAASSKTPTHYAAELYDLRKVFKTRRRLNLKPRCVSMNACLPLGSEHEDAAAQQQQQQQQHAGRPSDFWAMKGTWLGIEEGQLFCLLGPNGAGKTTTINCLTGVLPYTGGDALIYGQSISSEGGLDAIRPIMGVCPQFDVLWSELTGQEHLMIFGHIKGVQFSQVRQQAADLLERVKLSYAAHMRSGSYSGGMKRRLSVAIALLGDPKIVYLDEPTTGMDPISRRYVWDIIQAAKPGRAIVLTTHSMEEADILGDRIAIMARGQIKAIGSSVRLKQKFGSGYQLTVHVHPAQSRSFSVLDASQQTAHTAAMEKVKDFFRQHLSVEPVDEGRSLLHYLLPQHCEHQLTTFLSELEQQSRALGISDLQCSLASLEEVFLNIAKQAELDAAAMSGNSMVSVELSDEDGHLLVPLGEEQVCHPSGDGRMYHIKWAQDDEGRLVVLDCKLVETEAAAAAPAGPVESAAAAAVVPGLR